MEFVWSRRNFLGLAATGASGLLLSSPSLAQTATLPAGNGLLEKMRKAGVARVGITNGPPYSSLNIDGTLGGVAPTITALIMQRLGVPKLEGFAAPYGQLIPGLQAGRWDFISAALTITKARCEQVTYSDPFLIDGVAFAYLPSEVPNPPRTVKGAGERFDRIGMLTGAATIPMVQRAVAAGKQGVITQYPDNSALIEALLTKRIQAAFSGIIVLHQTQIAKNNAFEVVHHLPDDFAHGSGPAFRPTDTDLIEAFKTEFRKMKQSGEAKQIIQSFGFSVMAEDQDLTAEQACAQSE